MKTSFCKGCNREIIWARNPATEKLVPLDAHPVPYYCIVDADPPEAIKSDELVYINHYLTCPQADKFNKEKL